VSGIFNASIFNNTIFNTGDSGVVVVDVKTGTGGIDPKKKRRTIYKPTGLVNKKLEQRVVESQQIQREVYEEVIKPQFDVQIDLKPIQEMTSAEVDREIGLLMREKLRAEDEDDMMLVMMIAAND